MQLTYKDQMDNALDFLSMSIEEPEPGEKIDRKQLAEQLQYTIADAEDTETIATMIEDEATRRAKARELAFLETTQPKLF